MDRWVGVLVEAGRQLWNLGEIGDDLLEEQLIRAKLAANFPARDPQVSEITLYEGEPHQHVLAAGTVRDPVELNRITPAAVQAYRDQWTTAARQGQLAAARQTVAQLHPDDKATLRGEMGKRTGTDIEREDMMRLLWLPDVLRAAGLTVHEYDGWKTRGLDRKAALRGVICHGTGGSVNSTDSGETRTIAITGSNTATAPIAELYQSRTGAWWVLASGVCTGVKTGTGGPLKGYGDTAVLQIEAQHHPTEPWTEVQYQSYVVGVAAIVRYLALPVGMVIGHGEHQPGEKTDPWFDMNQFRRDVAAVLDGDDDMSIEQKINDVVVYGGTDMGRAIATTAKGHRGNGLADKIDGVWAAVDAANISLVALRAVIEQLAEAIRNGGGNIDTVGILRGVDERLEAHRAKVEADMRDAIADAEEGGAAAVRADA